MEVEMLKLVKDSEGRVRYEVNGVMLRENRLPRVGLSTVRHIGSDSYAQKIVEVAPDFSWYKLSTNEIAVLVTRKNSRRYGKYVLRQRQPLPPGEIELFLLLPSASAWKECSNPPRRDTTCQAPENGECWRTAAVMSGETDPAARSDTRILSRAYPDNKCGKIPPLSVESRVKFPA